MRKTKIFHIVYIQPLGMNIFETLLNFLEFFLMWIFGDPFILSRTYFFINLVPSSEETSFLTTFYDLYFSHHYTHITQKWFDRGGDEKRFDGTVWRVVWQALGALRFMTSEVDEDGDIWIRIYEIHLRKKEVRIGSS